MASSYGISGSGLAKANTMGFSAILLTISLFKIPPLDSPKKTSASCIASSRVQFLFNCVKYFLFLSKSFLLLCINPLESKT